MRDRKIQYKKYNDTHKEERKEWRNKNKNHIKKRIKKWYQENKERIKEVKKEWKKKNIKLLREYGRIDRLKHKQNYLARRLSQNIKIPLGQICEFCNISLAKEKHHPDYSKPLEVQFLCSKCNNPWNEGLGVKN